MEAKVRITIEFNHSIKNKKKSQNYHQLKDYCSFKEEVASECVGLTECVGDNMKNRSTNNIEGVGGKNDTYLN